MKNLFKKIACALIITTSLFTLVGCGDNDLEDVIVGTWQSPGEDSLLTIRNDGTCSDSAHSKTYSWTLDKDILTIYKNNNNSVVVQFLVEMISNDSLKLTYTKNGEEKYADRVK